MGSKAAVAVKSMSRTDFANLVYEDNATVHPDTSAATFEETKRVIGAIERSIGKALTTDGMLNLFGMFKIVVVNKPATKEHKGISPFTGEETVFKAKPAKRVIKVRPLKRLKDLI
jgi:nucleoid DNA-binding protein